MYSGLSNLSSHSSEFGTAKKYAVPLAVLSLFSLYQVQKPVGQVTFDPLSVGLLVVGLITTVLDLLLVYHLCLGIVELAQNQSNDELQDLARRRWKLYLLYTVTFAVWFPLGLIAPFLLAIGFLPMFIISLTVLVLMMILMNKSKDSLQ
jgi:succinate dehydrogenase/fumarate reductase cytochrome b subunit